MGKVTKEMGIIDIVQQYPESLEVFAIANYALVVESVDTLDLKSNGANNLVPVQVWPRAPTIPQKRDFLLQ